VAVPLKDEHRPRAGDELVEPGGDLVPPHALVLDRPDGEQGLEGRGESGFRLI
jgi:hypothetical protein